MLKAYLLLTKNGAVDNMCGLLRGQTPIQVPKL